VPNFFFVKSEEFLNASYSRKLNGLDLSTCFAVDPLALTSLKMDCLFVIRFCHWITVFYHFWRVIDSFLFFVHLRCYKPFQVFWVFFASCDLFGPDLSRCLCGEHVEVEKKIRPFTLFDSFAWGQICFHRLRQFSLGAKTEKSGKYLPTNERRMDASRLANH